MNRLFVAYKPPHIGSNQFLGRLKRKYGVKKAGFSGTLDPFACGCLIVAFGNYTKLFNHLQKTPKTYRATMWLGVNSPSLDIENIESIEMVPKLDATLIQKTIESLKGQKSYTAPKFSAKRIRGKRAYDLARANEAFTPPTLTATIYSAKFINYNHPFITFEVSVSEGTYIRSLCELVAQELQVQATLSYLKRINEGKFFYEEEKSLDPMQYLSMEQNYYEDLEWVLLGKKLEIEKLRNKEDGIYFIELDEHFSIIEVKEKKITYLKNRITKSQERCLVDKVKSD